jgi:hypothetical protein
MFSNNISLLIIIHYSADEEICGVTAIYSFK